MEKGALNTDGAPRPRAFGSPAGEPGLADHGRSDEFDNKPYGHGSRLRTPDRSTVAQARVPSSMIRLAR